MNNYIWYKEYPKSVNHEVYPDEYTSLVDYIDRYHKEFKDRVGYVFMNKEVTYREMDKHARDFAAYLQSLGLKKGDKLGIQLPNMLQYIVAILGGLRAGLVIVNVNPLYSEKELEHQHNDAGVTAVVCLANFVENLEIALPKTKIKHVIITEIGDMLGGIKGSLINFAVKYIKKMVPSHSIPNVTKFNKALKIGAQSKYTPQDISINDVAFLQYTGGTTGVAKGAMLSHRNIISNALMIREWMKPKLSVKNQEVMMTPLPLYHIFSLTTNLFAVMKVGVKNILIINPRDLKSFVKDMKKYPYSVITGLNTLFNALLNNEGFRALDFSKLKVTVAGGMAMQQSVAEEWEKVTGVKISEGYGLTETSPVLTVNPIDDRQRITTVGIPVPSTHVKIIDDDENELPQGESGEICGKGPQIMLGYLNRPDETKKVFTKDGYFKTGDIGLMLPDGFFKIVDRKKDMILVSGFNVYPNEVEDAIAFHPKVNEVACIGIPDERSNERVKVFIVPKDPSLTKEEIKEICEHSLAHYKHPKEIEFRTELPLSNLGKVLRKDLKKEEEEKRRKA